MVAKKKCDTDRKTTCASCKEEEKLARKYLNVAGVMIATLGKDGAVTLINQKGCEVLGYSEDEIIGKNWFDAFLPQEVVDKTKEIFGKLMNEEIKSVEYHENPILRKDGQERLLSFHNTVLRNESGEVNGILFSGEDVTDQRRAEKEVAQKQSKLQKLNDSMMKREAEIAEMEKRIAELEKLNSK